MPQFLVAQQPCHPFCDAFLVLRRYPERRLAKNLREGRIFRRQNRRATGHGFQRGQPKSLVMGREREKVRGGVKSGKIFVLHESRHMYLLSIRRVLHLTKNTVVQPPLPPGYHQVMRQAVCPFHQAESTNEPIEILARLQGAKAENERRVSQVVFSSHAGHHVGDGMKPGFHPGVHHAHFFRWGTQEIHDVLPGGFRIGQNAVSPGDGFRNHRHQVGSKGWLGVFRKSPERKVVNRNDCSSTPDRWQGVVRRVINIHRAREYLHRYREPEPLPQDSRCAIAQREVPASEILWPKEIVSRSILADKEHILPAGVHGSQRLNKAPGIPADTPSLTQGGRIVYSYSHAPFPANRIPRAFARAFLSLSNDNFFSASEDGTHRASNTSSL